MTEVRWTQQRAVGGQSHFYTHTLNGIPCSHGLVKLHYSGPITLYGVKFDCKPSEPWDFRFCDSLTFDTLDEAKAEIERMLSDG
jgi:hypothetical protein